jgi:hypothetical protein
MTTLKGIYATIGIKDLLELHLCQLEVCCIPYRYTHREKNPIIQQAVEEIRAILEHAEKGGSDRYGLGDIPF